MNADWQNKLYFGDNLEILRDHVGEESVDLIYLDPPSNSKATYSVLFKEKNGTASAAQVIEFAAGGDGVGLRSGPASAPRVGPTSRSRGTPCQELGSRYHVGGGPIMVG